MVGGIKLDETFGVYCRKGEPLEAVKHGNARTKVKY